MAKSSLESYLAARKAGAEALKEKMEKSSDAMLAKKAGTKKAIGTGLGAAAGAVGTYFTGNPALISMGAQLGGQLAGATATGAEEAAAKRTGTGDEAAKAIGNVASIASQVGGIAKMLGGGQYNWGKMSDQEITSALQKNPGLYNTDTFQSYLKTRTMPLPAFATE